MSFKKDSSDRVEIILKISMLYVYFRREVLINLNNVFKAFAYLFKINKNKKLNPQFYKNFFKSYFLWFLVF